MITQILLKIKSKRMLKFQVSVSINKVLLEYNMLVHLYIYSRGVLSYAGKADIDIEIT